MSFASDLKAAYDSLYSGRVFLDTAPPRTPFPYITINLDILRVPVTSGDGRTSARRRRAQVNIFQLRGHEDEALITATEVASEVSDVEAPRTRATVTFSRRLPFDPATPDVTHRVLWVESAERVPVT